MDSLGRSNDISEIGGPGGEIIFQKPPWEGTNCDRWIQPWEGNDSPSLAPAKF